MISPRNGPIAVGGALLRRARMARFFLELALRDFEQRLVSIGFAFGNRPVPVVLVFGKWAAGMREEKFQLPVPIDT